MAQGPITVTYYWHSSIGGRIAPWLNGGVTTSDGSCTQVEWDLIDSPCEDFPVPDPCNQIPKECPATIAYLINQIMWEINRKASEIGDERMYAHYDDWRHLDRFIRQVAPEVATAVDGIYTVSRLRVEPGRNVYCLPPDYGAIVAATFGCTAVAKAQAAFDQETVFCPNCVHEYPQYKLNKENVGSYYADKCQEGLPRGYSVVGTNLYLDRVPQETGEVRIWHRANTLIVEDCPCSDMIFENCQCGGTHPQSAHFYGGVSVKHLALIKKLAIGEWFMVVAPEHADGYKSEARGLGEFYSQRDRRPELSNTKTRIRYKGF